MNRKILLLTVLMAAPGLATSASVYKWTDEQGITHFGDRQPTGQAVEQVNVRSGTSQSSASGRQSAQEQLGELEEQQAAQQQRQAESAAEEARRKQREANCATARSNLEVINSNARIRVEEKGETRYLNPDEIEQQRQRFQEIANENCGPDQPGASER
ncbi:DUF4124 domain-containing protein [Marinobacter daepoensis]|uniref:DUF4124 domain-containing protein n=1 Tax=Marinobacter daepoensis TaxID=262077 RepID=A0ABS3BF61_9GAMM|nr:DUF4124 domain-containing protein [Marinobacter daepoensis]MBN7770483.1 DUF4124 domain-containing protein [Marinobacter daepoensis]MBY6034746.1 DUF4124 domain-containing protein [Marinobacter daepoensis]MBY6080425.1 DUF4124 domain-containing protein [Marinobacter daepoensis]